MPESIENIVTEGDTAVEVQVDTSADALRLAAYDLLELRRKAPKSFSVMESIVWDSQPVGEALDEFQAGMQDWALDFQARIVQLQQWPSDVNIHIEGRDLNGSAVVGCVVGGLQKRQLDGLKKAWTRHKKLVG